MAHIRQQIRETVKTALTGLSTTGSNVFVARVYPHISEGLPGLCIHTPNEPIDEDEGKIEGVQLRYVSLVVRGCAAASSNVEDTLDDIASEVETALLADDLFRATDLTETTTDISSEGQKPIGNVEMTFRVQVMTNKGQPDIML